LFWEAAEGGIGVFERLVEDQAGLAAIARQALELCHIDPATGRDRKGWSERCSAACYDCVLSYTNQLDHRHLDRNLIRVFLFSLTKSETTACDGGSIATSTSHGCASGSTRLRSASGVCSTS
jgi:hypothetical protein